MSRWRFDIENIPKSYYKDQEYKYKGEKRIRQVLVRVNMFVVFEGHIYRTSWLPKKNQWSFGKGTPEAYQLDPEYPKELGEPADKTVFEIIQDRVESGESAFVA